MAKSAPRQEGERRRDGAGRRLLGVAPWLGLAAMTALWMQARTTRKPGLSEQDAAPPEVIDAREPGRGRLAAYPHHIPLRGWRDIVWRTWLEIGRDRLASVAGGVTFYTLLAIFPAMGVFASLYGLFADVETVSKHLDALSLVVPQDALQLIGEQMVRLAVQRPANLSVAFAISLVLSVWSANAGMSSLFDGLNVAYDERERRNFFQRRLLTLSFTAGLLIFGVAVVGLLLVVPAVVSWLGPPLQIGWMAWARWPALAALAAAGFSVLYRHGPSRERARWRWVTWGGVLAAVIWVAGSAGLTWYVDNVAHIDLTYGSLATVIGFMMWIWFSALSVLIGAELNAEIEHQTALDSTTGAPEPMGRRGAVMADTVGVPSSGPGRWIWALQRKLGPAPPSRKSGRL